MKLSELLNKLGEIAKENNLVEPMIVGGLPRDREFGIPMNIKDIDITCGNNSTFALALSSSHAWPDAVFRSYDDGHSSLDFHNIRLDFSNNWVIPNIETELRKVGIEEPTDLQKEVFSRDFTINTLLQPIDLGKPVIDPTGFALKDIKDKILRTPINPELTIGYDPRRILRAIKFQLKFDLTIEPELKGALLKFRGNISNLPLNSIKKQVNQLLQINSKKALELLNEYKLLPILPLSKLMGQEIINNHMIQNLFE